MLLFFVNIINWLEAHQIPCLFKSLTHFDCPGCGMQRSFILLMKGDITSSFFMYPALIPILLLFAFLFMHVILKIKFGTLILKYTYFVCTGIILVSYIIKLLTAKI